MLSRSLRLIAWFCCCNLPILLIGCGPEFAEPASQFSSVATAGEAPGENQQGSITEKKKTNPTPDFSSVPTVPASSVMQLPLREEKSRYHQVASGETLSLIARQLSVSVDRLRKTNLLNRSTIVEPGQLLIVPESR